MGLAALARELMGISGPSAGNEWGLAVLARELMGNSDPEEGDLRKEMHMMTSSHSSLKECCLLDRKTVWTPPNFWCVGRSGTYRNEHFG